MTDPDTPSVAAPVAKAVEAQSLRAEVERLKAALRRINNAAGLFGEPASGQHAREIARAALATSEGEG